MFMPNALTDFLDNTNKQFCEKTALICGDQRMTWGELDELSDRVANGLLRKGIKRSDRVIVCLDNCIETIILFWAILKLKAIVSIIHPSIPIARLNWILNDSSAHCLFFRDASQSIQYVLRENQESIKIPLSVSYHYTELYMSSTDFIKQSGIDLDLAAIIYTSGSTGTPKGVMLTHRNMLTAANSIVQYLELQANDRIISALPLSFDYGLYQMILVTIVGATLILEKDFVWPLHFLKKLAVENATIFPGVATQFSILSGHMSKLTTYPSIRMVTNTGATLFDKHTEVIQKIFPNAIIFSMYGLTECKRCTYLPPKDFFRKSESVGVAIPNTEIWTIDEAGNKCLPFEIGQLVVRGGTIMRGYWNNAVDTEKVLKDSSIPGEKILYTGDYGYLDNDGYFYFHGRRDDTVKRYGEKVSLKIIEDTIRFFPAVNEVVVIDLPDDVTGVSIIVFVGTDSLNQSESDLMSHCRSQLPKSHWPFAIYFMSELPRTLNGKYDKQLLKMTYQQKIPAN